MCNPLKKGHRLHSRWTGSCSCHKIIVLKNRKITWLRWNSKHSYKSKCNFLCPTIHVTDVLTDVITMEDCLPEQWFPVDWYCLLGLETTDTRNCFCSSQWLSSTVRRGDAIYHQNGTNFHSQQERINSLYVVVEEKKLFLPSTCQETLEDRQLIPQKIKGILSNMRAHQLVQVTEWRDVLFCLGEKYSHRKWVW